MAIHPAQLNRMPVDQKAPSFVYLITAQPIRKFRTLQRLLPRKGFQPYRIKQGSFRSPQAGMLHPDLSVGRGRNP